MRAVAATLFEVSRLESIVLLVFIVHAIIVWCWRRDGLKRWLGIGWFMLFAGFSVFVFPGVLSRATDGTGYVLAHLYGGIWRSGQAPIWHTAGEALANVLLRWQRLLPVYGPWLSVWLGGLIGILTLSAARDRIRERASFSR